LAGLIYFISRNARRSGKLKRACVQFDQTPKTVPPFDRKSALPVPIHTVLKGRAFVVDGDTVVVRKTQIRLFGIDAPELTHPFGKRAKWALVSLCKGQRIEAEVVETDVHGRIVAKCRLEDGRDLSAEMVKLGLAIDWPRYSKGVYKRLELPGVRKKLWLADARQKGHRHV
jgi:endonuclease YncB( thermonuclease family)